MSDWIEQFSAALDERDAREQAFKSYVDAYTALADRTASLEANQPNTDASLSRPASGAIVERTSTPTKGKAPLSKEADVPPHDQLSRLRGDVAAAQKGRATLQTQVDELTAAMKTLEAQSRTSTTQIVFLTRQKTDAERKVRDRDEELRIKSKLVEQAQDEQVALGLQLNIAEQRSERLTKENKDLVDRWMKRMGEEADKVNRDSKWE